MATAHRRVTIRDLAQATGLSQAAVSYALRGTRVSEDTRERVHRAAQELGYRAHPAARALARGRTGLVGVLWSGLDDLWQQQTAVAVSAALLAEDLQALVVDSGADPAREERLAGRLLAQGVDALVVNPVDPAAPGWAALAAQVPVVAVGDALPGARGDVLFDNRAGVRLALEHLADLGHRRIGVLTPTRTSTPDRPGDQEVTTVAAELGLDARVVASGSTLDDAACAARDLLTGDPAEAGPTALFCFADSIAYGALAAARDLGLRVPHDLSVLGYDGLPISALVQPALTTIDWDGDAVVRAVAAFVAAFVADPPEPGRGRVVVRPRLQNRASTGPTSG